jgi:hypothetical protein
MRKTQILNNNGNLLHFLSRCLKIVPTPIIVPIILSHFKVTGLQQPNGGMFQVTVLSEPNSTAAEFLPEQKTLSNGPQKNTMIYVQKYTRSLYVLTKPLSKK